MGPRLLLPLILLFTATPAATAAAAPIAVSGVAQDVTSVGAVIPGQVSPGGRATTYRVEYGTTSASGSRSLDRSAGRGTRSVAVRVPLGGLTANTVYHYRLVAVGGGTTARGADRTFRTVAATAGAVPQPSKLGLTSATINRASRTIEILAPVSSRASGLVGLALSAAGRIDRWTAPIDSAHGRISDRHRISAAQAAQGSGILTITYPGDPDTNPQVVRLRAANGAAALRASRPSLVNGRLQAKGTISPRARGVVRIQLEYVSGGKATRLEKQAKIASGRWQLDTPLTAGEREAIDRRRGTVQSYIVFTGYQPANLRGEMLSYQVLGAGPTPGGTTPGGSGATVPGQSPTSPSGPAPVDLKVNFQTATTVTPAGYLADLGQAYDATRGYGWVDAATGAPLSLVGNGRERNVDPDKRLDTFMSMQLTASSAGVPTPGSWKAAVPDGTYVVTVAVGDPSFTDSRDVIRLEGQKVIDFTPTSSTHHLTSTATVTVTDGMLNVDAQGGTNTKIDYLRAQTVSAGSPRVTAVQPAAGESNVCRDGAVTVQLSDGIDPTTANATGLQLLNPSGAQVAGFYNTDGAYSNATFVPSAVLSPNATYTVRATSALKDPAGDAYSPSTTTFTTGSNPCANQANVRFNASTFDFSDGTAATTTAYKTEGPTALALGPNPNSPTQLWAAFGTGNILVYNLDPTTGQATGAPAQVSTFKFQRLVSGLRFDPSSTASNIKLWVSNGQFGCDLAAMGVACDDFTGAVSTLTGSSVSSLAKTDIVTGLPRSVGNHMNNGVDFAPDGALYLAQGANNGYGSPDAIWGNRSEDPLTAAILRIDVAGITSPPLNVNTSPPTNYNPSAAGAKVMLYATGTRNPFSVLWHSNGKLYAPVNESANGNTPADPNGGAPALDNLPAFNDYFTQIVTGKFYGHPNPARGEYRLNGANPTAGADPFEVPQYPVGTQPNANWRQPDLDLGLHRSADGSVEYKSNVFGAELQGQILVTEYSQGKDIIAVKLDGTGKPISTSVVASGFNNPLPIATDNATGRVYVGEYGRDPDGVGGKITLLTPVPAADKTLASFPGNAGGVANTGFTTALNAVDPNKIAFSGGQLHITTSNDSNTNHTNALALNISATTKFRVQGRLVGSFAAIDTGAEQQGIFWGPDNVSFIKPEVESGFHGGSGTPGRVLTIWMQDNGTGSILLSVPLPGGDANTVDLRLDVDPSPPGGGGGQANVSYSIDGGTFTPLNSSPIAIPARWFAANTYAGIIHSNQEGGSPFTATYANFSTSRL
jgi:glucose/arabinose dehydrogenase